MLGTILKFLGGGVIGQIGDQINSAYDRYLTAETNEKKLEIKAEIRTLEARKEILLAEQKSKLTSWIRPAFAFPFVVFVYKVVIWDTVLGLGTTSHLSEQMYDMMTVIAGAYFLTRPIEKVFRSK